MSYTPPINPTYTSPIGVNSDNVISGGNWTGNTYIGAGEQNDYSYVGVVLQTDEAGTLTFEFSQDGVNWSEYPTVDFTIASGINEVHGAWKGTRYVRPKFIGTGGRTYFRLRTMYSYAPVTLSAPLNQPINPDSDASIVRSVSIGEVPSGSYSNSKGDCLGFSTNSVLTSGQTYDSGVLSLVGYTQVQTDILSVGANGTTTILFYEDAGGTNLLRTLTSPYIDGDGFKLLSAPAFTPYVRYRFTCTSVGQTQFYFDTKFITKALSGQILGLNDFVAGGMVANLGRNVIVGQDNGGNFRNVGTDNEGSLSVRITDPTTAFGDLKTSEMTPVLQVTHPYEINYNVVSSGQSTSIGSLSYNTGTTLVNVNSGAASASKGVMTSRRLAKYRNGQGLSIRFTAIFDTPVAGNEQWAGWGDDMDGFFFGYSGTTFGSLRRNSSSGDVFTPKSSWNTDKMDGSKNSLNPSGQLLNPQLGNVYEIQIQWLGFGAISFKIENSSNGIFQEVNQIKYANTYTVPSLINPTFPIRFESNNTSNTSNVVIKNASFAAFNEGIIQYTGPRFSFSNNKATTTDTAIFILNNPLTYKGKLNRTRILLKSFSYFTDQSNGAAVDFKIIRNGTLAGASYTNIDTYSPIQQSTVGTYTSNTGQVLFTSALPKVDGGVVNLTDIELFLNPGETISVVGNGSNTGSGAALTWVEDI